MSLEKKSHLLPTLSPTFVSKHTPCAHHTLYKNNHHHKPSWLFPNPPNYNLSVIKGVPGERLWGSSVWNPRSKWPQFWERELWTFWKVGIGLKSLIIHGDTDRTGRISGGLQGTLLPSCLNGSWGQASGKQKIRSGDLWRPLPVTAVNPQWVTKGQGSLARVGRFGKQK
jgi:hypothetical protein